MKVTIELLKQLNACEDQVALFARLYPLGVEATLETVRKAIAAGLEVWWLRTALVDEYLDEWDAYWQKFDALNDHSPNSTQYLEFNVRWINRALEAYHA